MSQDQNASDPDPFAIPPPRPKADPPPSTVVGEVPPAVRPPPMPAEQISPATIVGTVPPMPAEQISPVTIVGTVPPMFQQPYGALPQGWTPEAPTPGGSARPGTAGPGASAPPYPAASPLQYATPAYGQASGWRRFVEFVKFHFERAISRDLRTVDVAPGEQPLLSAYGVYDHTICQYLLWRRSWLYLLLPLAAVAATIEITSFFATDVDTSTFKWYGVVLLVGTAFAQMLGYPIAAGLAVWKWESLRLSRWILIAGFVVTYLLPFLVALIPMGNFILIEESDPDLVRGQKFGAGVAGAMIWLFGLLPAILAIMPGILRASVRIKSLLPESIVPGWIIVMTAPFFTLVLLLVFITINQVAGNLLLIFGTLLIMASPAVFLMRSDLLIKPVTDFGERRRLEALQIVYVTVVAIGMAMLMVYLFTLEILGKPLVGDTADATNPAMISVTRFSWEMTSFVITYTAKSVFITAVAIDLFMLLNLSVWKNLKAFEGSPHAAEYDRIMGSFQNLVEGQESGRAPPAGFEVVPQGSNEK